MSYATLEEVYQAYLNSNSVRIDSREVESNDFFVALQGSQSDGNLYAEKAIAAGASFALIDNPAYKTNEQCLLVADALGMLQDLARHHREQFLIPIIAITGSNGKTTTKELLADVLAKSYRCHFTQGNYNNHIGVPLTLLSMSKDTEVAVVEMGANHQGEIAELCRIALPTHGIITNIGKAHLEGFGGIEGVKKGKSELYGALDGHGVAFVNTDESFLLDLAKDRVQRKVYYGTLEEDGTEKWLKGKYKLDDEGNVVLTFWSEQGEEFQAHSQLTGRYNYPNLLTAAMLGQYFKVSELDIKIALEAYMPSINRSQKIVKADRTFILDAYNANPSSIALALDNLESLVGENKIAILGEMKELGAYSKVEHERILKLALEKEFSAVITVGQEFAASSLELGVSNFLNVDELKAAKLKFPEAAIILLKGSRSVRLEAYIQ